jgi:hypothetical protein
MTLPQSGAKSPSVRFLTLTLLLVVLMPKVYATTQLTFTPTDLRFGQVAIGQTKTMVATMVNTGLTDVTVSTVQVNAAEFTVSQPTLPLTLAPGQRLDVKVTFQPAQGGRAIGNIALNGAAALRLHGWGSGSSGAGQLTIAPAALNFGSVAVGSSATQTGVLSAAGASITISSASSSGAEYSLSGLSLPATIAPGSSASFTVTFAPRSSAATTASLSFVSNAGNNPKPLSLTGTGGSVTTGSARGMFILNPPIDDKRCAAQGYPAACYSAHLVPTFICTGVGTPAGHNCQRQGAGTPYIKGAVFQVPWTMLNPGNGTYDFSKLDSWMQPWIDSGKLTSFIFQPTSFGVHNGFTPNWYITPVSISSVSQAGGIITLHTSSDMGFFPGGIGAAAGLEIQIAGTRTALDGNDTPANPGIWTVCDHNTSGCQDPTARTISAIGSKSDIAPVSAGTVGNPVYGSADGSACTSGVIPIQWRVNFQRAWQAFMEQAVRYYGANSHVAYMRFGMGVGGQSNPTGGTNLPACQTQMAKFGFTKVAAAWPAPGSAQWAQVSANWIAYMDTMSQFMRSLHSPKPVMFTLSPIEYSPDDLTTPDAEAANAAAAGIGFGNQGLSKNDPINFAAGKPCLGGDWCANFQKFRGRVPLELQTVLYSDPTNASHTGSLVNLLPFAVIAGADILELYPDDWMCTFDPNWRGVNSYSACTSAGYAEAFLGASGRIN